MKIIRILNLLNYILIVIVSSKMCDFKKNLLFFCKFYLTKLSNSIWLDSQKKNYL